jgi:hypothetical protein
MSMTSEEAVAEILTVAHKDRSWLDNFLSLPTNLQADVIANEKDQDWTDPATSFGTRALAAFAALAGVAGNVGTMAGAASAVRALTGK